MYLNDGVIDGRAFCRRRGDRRLFTTRQVADRALGWQKPDGMNSAGHLMSPEAFGHTGFTGTSIWMDPTNNVFIILLSNRVNPTRANTKIGRGARSHCRRRRCPPLPARIPSITVSRSMHLTAIDWAIVVAYFALSAGIGLLFTKKGGESLEEYFISGRQVPWWLAGASMVATTFAADTPLVVTGLVAANGVAGNWLWWNMLMSGMLTVFFFARLWRRANVMTDVEFAEVRYSGNAPRCCAASARSTSRSRST